MHPDPIAAVRPPRNLAATLLALAAFAGPALPLHAAPLDDPAAASEPSGGALKGGRLPAGEAALQRGDCRQAAEAYVKASAASRDTRLARRAAEVAVSCEQPAAAWTATSRWRALDPENVDALRAVGLVAIERWKIDEARATFRELLAKPDVEPDLALGDLLPPLLESEQAAGAWLVFGTVVDRARASNATLLSLARLAIAGENYGEARALVNLVRARAPADPQATKLHAALEAARGDAAAALAAAQDAARLDPGNAAFAVAETLGELDRNEEARRELERLAEDGELKPEAERRLALLSAATGDFADAQRRFASRLARGENPAEAVFYLGLIAERSGNEDVALAAYRRLIEAGAGLPPRARAASILLERKETAAALALIDDFVKANPGSALEGAITRAQLLSEAGAHAEAVAALDRALEAYPDHHDLLYQRAMVFERGDRTRDAVREFERLLKARPGDPSIGNALGYTLADNDQQLARAEKLIRDALVLRPDSAAFLDSLGWALFRRGDARGALPWLERAWQLSRDAEIAAHWGEVLWSLDSKSEARAIWARALARAPDSKPLVSTVERLTGQTIPREAAPATGT
jgi:tetratricopeptide (TPR) repeat protein